MKEFITAASLFTGSWVVFTGGVWRLFEKADKVLSSDSKKKISKWLQKSGDYQYFTRWASDFSIIFDSVFGRKRVSISCFFRSSIASFLAILILIMIWGALRTNEFLNFVEKTNHQYIIAFFIVGCITNLLPDYLSLLETRYAISISKKSTSISKHVLIIIFDFIFTAAIAFTWIHLVARYIVGIEPDDVFKNWATYVLPLSYANDGFPSPGVFFYSTFLTSVWLYLYLLSSWMLRWINLLNTFKNKLIRIFDVIEKPIISLGAISIIFISFLYIVVFFIYIILKHI